MITLQPSNLRVRPPSSLLFHEINHSSARIWSKHVEVTQKQLALSASKTGLFGRRPPFAVTS